MTTALVIGGGIAGPTTALALQRAGLEPIVFEAYPRTSADVGSYFTITPNGLDVLHGSLASTWGCGAITTARRNIHWSPTRLLADHTAPASRLQAHAKISRCGTRSTIR